MKIRTFFTSLCCICLVFIFASVSSADVIKLSLADQNSEVAWGPTHAMKPWVKMVEEATNGKLKIDIYFSQTLAKGTDIWNAVKMGVADIGWCFHGNWSDMTPLSDVVTLPSLPIKSAEQMSTVFWKLYEKYPSIQNEYKDVHVVTLWVSSPFFLITTKKQIKKMEDVKGLKIRVVGGPPTIQMKALGAVPTLIPMPDTYLSMDKGVIDGMSSTWEPIQGFRLYEIAPNFTIVPLTCNYFSLSMNKQKWDNLPKDIQNAITKLGGLEGAKFWGKNYFDSAEKGVDEQVKKGNFKINKYVLPPDEAARWRKISGEKIWNEWVTKMEDKGHPEARQILNTTLELLK